MSLFVSAIEIPGLITLDRYFSFQIIEKLQNCAKILENELDNAPEKNANPNLVVKTFLNAIVKGNLRPYQESYNKSGKHVWTEFMANACHIGQLQLLRKITAFYLNKFAKYDAVNIEVSLRNLNRALFLDCTKERRFPAEKTMYLLANYSDYVGLDNPLSKIYISAHSDMHYSILVFLFVLSQLNKLFFPNQLTNNLKRSNDQVDATVLLVALNTLLNQLNPQINEYFVKFLALYQLVLSTQSSGKSAFDRLSELTLISNFLELYSGISPNSRLIIKEILNEYILDIQRMITK